MSLYIYIIGKMNQPAKIISFRRTAISGYTIDHRGTIEPCLDKSIGRVYFDIDGKWYVDSIERGYFHAEFHYK